MTSAPTEAAFAAILGRRVREQCSKMAQRSVRVVTFDAEAVRAGIGSLPGVLGALRGFAIRLAASPMD